MIEEGDETETESPAARERRSTGQLRELLRIYAEQGRTLSSLAPLLGREVSTLKKHVRTAGVAFPDYRPRGAG